MIEIFSLDRLKLIVREIWDKAYEDKNSEAFKTFASSIKKSVEELYRAKKSVSNDYVIMANLGKREKKNKIN